MLGMRREHSRVVEAFYSMPWAILPETFSRMQVVLHRWADGERLTSDELAVAVASGTRAAHEARQATGPRNVGLVQIFGVLAQRTGLTETSEVLQGVDPIRDTLTQMIKDDSIGTILLEIDSPGGSVMGVEELWDVIFAARGEKKITAHVNSLAASAAYWIATAADEIVITPSGAVGAIGAFAAHIDTSKALEKAGLDVTLISAGEFKTEGNEFEPLSDEGREAMQTIVDAYYAAFVTGVSKGRGVKSAEVRGGFGQGRVLLAKAALAEGMVDRIDTLEGTLARATSSSRAQRSLRASAERQLEVAAL